MGTDSNSPCVSVLARYIEHLSVALLPDSSILSWCELFVAHALLHHQHLSLKQITSLEQGQKYSTLFEDYLML